MVEGIVEVDVEGAHLHQLVGEVSAGCAIHFKPALEVLGVLVGYLASPAVAVLGEVELEVVVLASEFCGVEGETHAHAGIVDADAEGGLVVGIDLGLEVHPLVDALITYAGSGEVEAGCEAEFALGTADIVGIEIVTLILLCKEAVSLVHKAFHLLCMYVCCKNRHCKEYV